MLNQYNGSGLNQDQVWKLVAALGTCGREPDQDWKLLLGIRIRIRTKVKNLWKNPDLCSEPGFEACVQFSGCARLRNHGRHLGWKSVSSTRVWNLCQKLGFRPRVKNQCLDNIDLQNIGCLQNWRKFLGTVLLLFIYLFKIKIFLPTFF